MSIFLALLLALAAALIFEGLEAAVDYTPTPPASSSAVDSSAGQSDVNAPKFCPHCGDKLTESFQWDQFCPFCGEKVEK